MRQLLVPLSLAVGALTTPAVQAGVVFGGHEYDIVTAEGITWTDANAAAAAMGGGWRLATVTSAAEDAFLI